MQGQESSSSSSPNQDQTNKLLQKYANTNIDALPESIIQEIEEENFLGVDISGTMNLTDISALPLNCLKETLVQSMQLEIEPFVNDKAQELLGTLGRITHRMVANDFIHQITDIANKNFSEFLPGYFNDQYESFVERCREVIETQETFGSTNEVLFFNSFCIETINAAIELNKEFLAYKMRWKIIKNIKDIMSCLETRENILKIPAYYSFALPLYLYLLSDFKENFTTRTVDENGDLIDSREYIQLENFFAYPPPWSSVEGNVG